MSRSTYAVALGSNRCHGRHGPPRRVIAAAIAALAPGVRAASRTIESAPLGPGGRLYANAAMLIDSAESPPALLARLKRVERAFGRRQGQRWSARVLDLDIILWSGGTWASAGLVVPHTDFRARAFVLGPLAQIAPGWRDPISGLTIRQLARRLDRRRPKS